MDITNNSGVSYSQNNEPVTSAIDDSLPQKSINGMTVSNETTESLTQHIENKDSEVDCNICYDRIALRDRTTSTTVSCIHDHYYHEDCINSYYKTNPTVKPKKNPDSKCFVCTNPLPLRAPIWDVDAFVCKIQKSELEQSTPYVGAPMTFSFKDQPDFTVSLGFKGAPWLFCEKTNNENCIKADEADNGMKEFKYRIALSTGISLIDVGIVTSPEDSALTLKTRKIDFLKDLLAFLVNPLNPALDPALNDFFDNEQSRIPDSLEMYFSEKGDIQAINYPLYPLKWCKPAMQWHDDVEANISLPCSVSINSGNTSAISTNSTNKVESPPLSSGYDKAPTARKQNKIEPITTTSISENSGSLPKGQNQQGRVSFQLIVTDLENTKTYAALKGITFNKREQSNGVFNDVAIADSELRESEGYNKFKKEFFSLITSMDSKDEFCIRVKPELIGNCSKSVGKTFVHVPIDSLFNELA